MLNLKTKLATGLASAGLLAASFSPAAALAADVSVVDNGAFSNNHVTVNSSSHTSVEQNNVAEVNTFVSQKANTGGNEQSFNTGDGGSYMHTGHATNTTSVSVVGGNNVAHLPENCGCEGTTVRIRDNGAFSNNRVNVSNRKVMKLNQLSYTSVNSFVSQKSNTGKNNQMFNTGSGMSEMRTHNATNNVDVDVHSGHNRIN